jgi:hypothetical protein
MGIAMGFLGRDVVSESGWSFFELTIQNGGFMDPLMGFDGDSRFKMVVSWVSKWFNGIHEDIHHSIGIESLNELI